MSLIYTYQIIIKTIKNINIKIVNFLKIIYKILLINIFIHNTFKN